MTLKRDPSMALQLGFLALLQESRRSDDFGACLQTLARCKPKIFGSNPPLVEEIARGRAAAISSAR